MKRLSPIVSESSHNTDIIFLSLESATTKKKFVSSLKKILEPMDIEFYDPIGSILRSIGFNAKVVRNGDVNCRMDAIIIDDKNSIPIEIKSPRESKEICIKSIRQACENKIILLSRKFHNTRYETSSLAIAFKYPTNRSDVDELINDFKKAFDINIGIIDIQDLLSLVWDINKEHRSLNTDYFHHFMGKFDYAKAFNQ